MLSDTPEAIQNAAAPRWSDAAAAALIDRPVLDLVFDAQSVHRRHFAPNRMERAQLMSIKTGGCPEDCAYCSQSARHDTPVKATPLAGLDAVRRGAEAAKTAGATRFCMGAAWRNPKDRDMDALCAMVREVKAMGLETCMTLGMLSEEQARRLAEAGLDYYNHNIDTAPRHYPSIVSTRRFQDRLDTLETVRRAGLGVCCGGILGMGESRADRAAMLAALANLPEPPGSVPINALTPQEGTPLARAEPIDGLEIVRTVAAARIMMPAAVVRLSAGRDAMSEELQTLCFLAGANSVFVGERLLTAGNPGADADARLFAKLGLDVEGGVSRV